MNATQRNRCLVVVRIRGSAGLSRELRDTLRMLNLHRSNWATLVPDTPSINGMLRKVVHCITWGEPDPKVLSKLFKKRSEVRSYVNLEEELKRRGINSLDELAEKICSGEMSPSDLKEIFKPYIRLHPPKGGFKRSVKRPYGDKGEYGYRGGAINELLLKMI